MNQCFKLKKCPWLFNSNSTAGSKPQVNYATNSSSGHSVDSKWLLDSGANQNVIKDIQNLAIHSEYDDIEDVMLVNGTSHSITHIGSVSFSTPSQNLTLNNILCVPALNKNLISVYQFCDTNNVKVACNPFSFCVKDLRTGILLVKGEPKNGVYEWPPTVSKSKSLQVLYTV